MLEMAWEKDQSHNTKKKKAMGTKRKLAYKGVYGLERDEVRNSKEGAGLWRVIKPGPSEEFCGMIVGVRGGAAEFCTD